VLYLLLRKFQILSYEERFAGKNKNKKRKRKLQKYEGGYNPEEI
jgi:hypothetical protein